MMKTLDPGPLTEEETQELDDFLLNAEGLEESMDISALDGFLTAIIIGPRTIMPSEWMRWVWDMEKGEDTPDFKDQAQAERILDLLMRHMNDIARTLEQDPGRYEPLLVENPNDGDPIPIIDEWCSGFMKGVLLDSTGWLPITVGKPDLMTTIMLYGTEEGCDALKTKDLSLEEHRALADGLADSVRKMHALWLEQRKAQIAQGKSPAVFDANPSAIPPKSAATTLAPAGPARNTSNVTAAQGCTEAREKFRCPR